MKKGSGTVSHPDNHRFIRVNRLSLDAVEPHSVATDLKFCGFLAEN
jgi:hypothetical protein